MRTLGAIMCAALGLALGGCGAASDAPSAQTLSATSATSVSAPIAPFRVTLPSGSVVALDERGVVTVDGDALGTLQADGRIESVEGETIAALLSDGRISFDGELTPDRVQGALLLEGQVAVLDISQDRTLTLRLTDGRVAASVPIEGITPSSRATALFVLAVYFLDTATEQREELAELLHDTGDPVRVRIPIEAQPTLGPASASVTIAVLEDFQCPFCARVMPTIDELMRLYPGQLRVVFFHRPLPFHPNARDAAAFAEEARAQRGEQAFWEAYRLLFENQRSLDRASLERYGAQLGLDVARLRRALDEGTHEARIAADEALALRLGEVGTPTFFVNGRQVRGAQPVAVFRHVIDEELALATRLLARGIAPTELYAFLQRDAREALPPEPPSLPSPPRPRPDPSAVYRVPVGRAPTRGRADALITIVIFTDFQCPFCGRVGPTLETIESTYGRDVRFVLRHNPLPFHPDAFPAAEAAMEAFAQRGARAFWQMHDLLFENQSALTRPDLERYAAQLHLDAARFARALDDHTHQAAIEEDQTLARELGAAGTPSFFVNGRLIRGAQPFESFQRVIDEELVRAREAVASGTPRRHVYEALTADGASAPVYLREQGE